MAKKISMIPEGQKAPTVAQVAADMGIYGKVFIANMKKQGYGLNDEIVDKPVFDETRKAMKTPTKKKLDEYFFVADYDPEDENMFDNEMFGEKYPFTPEGLQKAMAELEEAKSSGATNYNIYKRRFIDPMESEEEIISDPMNYVFKK